MEQRLSLSLAPKDLYMKASIRFILIDDNPVNNLLCSIVIEQAAGKADIISFELPETGLAYIASEYARGEQPTILLLDINMPTWSGWEFLDHFDKLDEKIQKQFSVYILSSSIDPADQQRSVNNKFVLRSLEKPLTEAIVSEIIELASIKNR